MLKLKNSYRQKLIVITEKPQIHKIRAKRDNWLLLIKN